MIGAQRRALEEARGLRLSAAERRCLFKRRHATIRGAEQEAARLQRYSKRFCAYACTACGYWHVGRRKLGDCGPRKVAIDDVPI